MNEKKESNEELINHIKDLSNIDRTILSLYYYEGLDYKEIARILGVSVDRVAKLHSKIVSLIRDKMNK